MLKWDHDTDLFFILTHAFEPCPHNTMNSFGRSPKSRLSIYIYKPARVARQSLVTYIYIYIYIYIWVYRWRLLLRTQSGALPLSLSLSLSLSPLSLSFCLSFFLSFLLTFSFSFSVSHSLSLSFVLFFFLSLSTFRGMFGETAAPYHNHAIVAALLLLSSSILLLGLPSQIPTTNSIFVTVLAIIITLCLDIIAILPIIYTSFWTTHILANAEERSAVLVKKFMGKMRGWLALGVACLWWSCLTFLAAVCAFVWAKFGEGVTFYFTIGAVLFTLALMLIFLFFGTFTRFKVSEGQGFSASVEILLHPRIE